MVEEQNEPTITHQDLDNLIIAFFESCGPREHFTAQELVSAFELPEKLTIQIRTRCLALCLADRLRVETFKGQNFYYKGPFTHYRHITPLFSGTPEHLVCHRDGRTLAWCPDELTAKLIRNALNRD